MTLGRHLTTFLLIASLLTLFMACLLGATPLGPDRVVQTLFGAGTPGDTVVIWQIRMPRALAAYAVGAALGLSGAALQGLLRNPLAEPGVLGVTASAALGATFALYYGLVSFSAWVLPVAAISGALIATIIIAIAAIKVQSVITLILIGVGLSSFSAALMSLLMNLAPNPFALSDMLNWMLGSVANRSLDDLYFAGPFLAIGFVILLATRDGLSALTLGEEGASGIGLDLRRQRIFVIIGTGLLTGAAVSIAGAIGFIGIIVPHIIRPMVRHDPARSLLPSALLAGIGLVLADILVRTVPSTSELKLGVVMALIGAPAFVWIAMRGRTLDD